jgi:hypothetical protein
MKIMQYVLKTAEEIKQSGYCQRRLRSDNSARYGHNEYEGKARRPSVTRNIEKASANTGAKNIITPFGEGRNCGKTCWVMLQETATQKGTSMVNTRFVTTVFQLALQCTKFVFPTFTLNSNMTITTINLRVRHTGYVKIMLTLIWNEHLNFILFFSQI